jgi:hypothetical protein
MSIPKGANRVRFQTFWYYRRGHGPRTRLRGAWGSAEFMAAYRTDDVKLRARQPHQIAATRATTTAKASRWPWWTGGAAGWYSVQ